MANPDAQPNTLQALLDQIDQAADDAEPVTIGIMLEGAGRRSFGPMILLPGLLLLSPLSGVPTMPTIIAIMVLLVAGQLLIGREYFWLPQFVLRRNMSHERFTRTMRWMRPPARFIDRWTGQRLTFLTSRRAITATAAASVFVALTMPTMELVPGASVAAAFALTMFGLALIAKDGLLMLFAYAAVAATAWFVIAQLAG